jgi:hypothetical protein
VLSFYLVALGVAYPVGSLVQGPVIDRIGIGWTTAASAVLLALVMAAVAAWRPAMVRAITTLPDGPLPDLDRPGGDRPDGPPVPPGLGRELRVVAGVALAHDAGVAADADRDLACDGDPVQ